MIDPKTLGDCGGCGGDVAGISESIVHASRLLVSGHMGLSELYKHLATQASSPEDKETFNKQAASHTEMAQKSAQVSVPDSGGNDGSHSSENRSGQ